MKFNISDFTMRNSLVVCLIMCVIGLIVPVNALAAATTSPDITSVLCAAVNQLRGPIGQAIAALIIISLAIALFLGKVTWGVAIAVAVGMGLLFGATGVVGLLTGGDANDICPKT
jgi:type IV secretion system protein VirB2